MTRRGLLSGCAGLLALLGYRKPADAGILPIRKCAGNVLEHTHLSVGAITKVYVNNEVAYVFNPPIRVEAGQKISVQHRDGQSPVVHVT